MKKIVICDKEFNIDCNALTLIKFKQKFNRGIFEDINTLKLFLNQQVLALKQLKSENPDISDATLIASLSGLMMNNMSEFIEAVTRITYILIYTANPNIEEYEDWLKNIPKIKTNDEWIVEVAEFAADCFC